MARTLSACSIPAPLPATLKLVLFWAKPRQATGLSLLACFLLAPATRDHRNHDNIFTLQTVQMKGFG